MKITTCLLMVVLLICTGCPDRDCCDSKITIFNNSNRDIVFWSKISKNDTLITFFIDKNNISNSIIDSKKNFEFVGDFRGTLDDDPSSRLMLYLFSRDTVEQVPWDSIVSDYKVLRRYGLSLSDLESRGWKVEYP